jgi:hypothetical protein
MLAPVPFRKHTVAVLFMWAENQPSKTFISPGASNPSYFGDSDQEDHGLRPA